MGTPTQYGVVIVGVNQHVTGIVKDHVCSFHRYSSLAAVCHLTCMCLSLILTLSASGVRALSPNTVHFLPVPRAIVRRAAGFVKTLRARFSLPSNDGPVPRPSPPSSLLAFLCSCASVLSAATPNRLLFSDAKSIRVKRCFHFSNLLPNLVPGRRI